MGRAVSAFVEFRVLGLPAPQGSKRHVGNGILVESSRALPSWRAEVAEAAQRVAPDRPLDCPLRLTVRFRFPMPGSRRVALRRAGIAPKTTAPDLDKLVRAVGDALADGGLIASDARLCELVASKVEVIGWTGCELRLDVLPEAEL